MSWFSGLFGKSKQTKQPAAALRVTSSLQGQPLPWLLGGQQRMPGNVIWYGDFQAVGAGTGSGGKGLGGGGNSASAGYTYTAAFMLAACEGPDISAIVNVWEAGTSSPAADYETAQFFTGTYSQNQWTFGASFAPTQMPYYRGICYAGFADFGLGSSASLPQINLEVQSTNSYVLSGIPDGDPSVCWTKFFTDPYRGVGFPTARMGNLTPWQQYCLATGMLVSPVLVSSAAASSFAKDLLQATNSNARWSAGLLTVAPYGDTAIIAGAQISVTETHIVPAANYGNDGFGYPIQSAIAIGFGNQFVRDQGVKYTATGVSFTYNSSLSATGEYTILSQGYNSSGQFIGNNVYVFNASDAGAQVSITYVYAQTASYIPNDTPVYALSLDNFMINQGTIGQGLSIGNSPLIVVRKPRDQMLNVVRLTYLDRSNSYNPVTIEVKNEAALQAFGRWRADSAKEFDFFCLGTAAQQSASLMLQREQIARTFQWTSPKEFILLDVMDIVTVTDASQGISNQAVRITEIQENEDFSLTFTAEEFMGTATAPLYNIQANSGFVPGFNESPGNANAPVIFEPTDELGGGLFVWIATSGMTPSAWGGCNVCVSTSVGGNYKVVATVLGSSRMGLTTSILPQVSISVTGQTIDQTNTLGVNLTESQGALNAASDSDAVALTTASYIGPVSNAPGDGFSSGFSSGFGGSPGGEIFAYANAALTSPYNYNLSYLIRGAYGTEDEITNHPIGSAFCFIDDTIAKISYSQAQIGSTIYIKLQGFNPYQGGLQPLAQCASYAYTITGLALASPLPDVENIYSNYEAGFEKIYWDEVSDFRNGVVYEVRQGLSWSTALLIRTLAHPPFIAQGNGTFWISARCQPVAGLIVYSESPSDIVISGNQLSLNLLESWDEKATNWTGTFQNGIGVDTSTNDLRLGGSGNILTDNPLLTSGTTSSSTAAGNAVLHFSGGIPANVVAGMAVNDTTHSTVIPSGTTVLSTTSTTVTMTNNATGAGVSSGDTIVFSTADILSYGGIITNTPIYYTIPTSHIVRSACITNAAINATATFLGVPLSQNILGYTNILIVPDILGSASTQYVDGWVEINVSQNNGATWAGWQKFVPGVFPGNAWNFRLALETSDASTIAYCSAFNFSVQLPARIDHYQNQTVPNTGLTIIFTPDGSGSTQAFNGGPAANNLPYYSVSWQAQTGDYYTVTGLSLSQLTITFYNSSNAAVQRTGVNITVEGS
jgi:Putative phage tail protein